MEGKVKIYEINDFYALKKLRQDMICPLHFLRLFIFSVETLH
jgi:hypothetical protein